MQTSCISAEFFLSISYGFLPVICSWSFVHQSSIFRVVDVLCAVSYTVAEDESIFFLSVMDFFLCVMVYMVSLSSSTV